MPTRFPMTSQKGGSSSTLSTELTGRLDLDVSFVWDRIQKPQARADGSVPEKDDYRLMLGLGFEF